MVLKEMWEGVFVDNEQTKAYLALCSKNSSAKGVEKHHILPKSIFPQFSKDSWNLVKLSYADHYKAHEILRRICMQPLHVSKMAKAFWSMGNVLGLHEKGSQAYCEARMEFIKSISGSNNYNYGVRGKDSPSYGRKPHLGHKHTDETRRKMSESRRGLKHSDEWVSNQSKARIGFKFTEETKAKMSESAKKRIRTKEEFARQAESNSRYSYQKIDSVTLEVLETFRRISDARTAGYKEYAIHKVISGVKKSHKGYKWAKVPKVDK